MIASIIKRPAYMGLFFLAALFACGGGEKKSADITPPPVPAGVSATDGSYGNKVTVTWSAAENADSYRIYKAIDSSDGDFNCIAKGVNVTEYEDATVSEDRVYYYRVRAVNGGGESELSSPDSGYAGSGKPAPPAAPAMFIASDTNVGFVELSWNAPEGAASYRVLRCMTINGVYGEIASVADTTYLDYDIDALTRYYYKVKAVNDDGESACSNYDGGRSLPPLPAAPPHVFATDGTWGNKVIVSWDELPEADTYTVYRADSIDGTYEVLASGLTPVTYTDYSGILGIHYYYKISGANVTGEGERSSADEGWSDPAGTVLPDVPAGVAASDDQNDQVTVTWSAAANATSYKVYRASAADAALFDESALVAPDVTEQSWVDTAVTAGVTYYYRVRAVNDASNGGDSGLSSADQGYAMGDAPGAPLNVQASDGIEYTITVSWNTVTAAADYRVYRSDAADGTYVEAGSGLTVTSWDDTTADFGVTYYYKVTAVNAWGESPKSDVNDGYCILSAPTGLTATDPESEEHYAADLSWNAVTGAEYFIIQRKQVLGGSWADIVTLDGSTTTYRDSGLGVWLEYAYRVRARAGTYDSAYSNTVKMYSD